ncbi:MAG: GntR family transcriptional regulator [Candidatus Dormiibacterota bacterium]
MTVRTPPSARRPRWVAEGERYRLLQPAERSLRQQVAASLRDAILTGSLKPGERLVEEEISQGMRTSRGPLREALRQLEQEGLVMSFPYRGSFVSRISSIEVREVLIPLRTTLEGFGFAHALNNLTETDVDDLHSIVEHMEDAVRNSDLTSLVEADVAFHGLVMSRSGQPHTTQIWGAIAPRIRAYFYTHLREALPTHDQLISVAASHRELFDALVARERDRVAALLVEHMQDLPGLPVTDPAP